MKPKEIISYESESLGWVSNVREEELFYKILRVGSLIRVVSQKPPGNFSTDGRMDYLLNRGHTLLVQDISMRRRLGVFDASTEDVWILDPARGELELYVGNMRDVSLRKEDV